MTTSWLLTLSLAACSAGAGRSTDREPSGSTLDPADGFELSLSDIDNDIGVRVKAVAVRDIPDGASPVGMAREIVTERALAASATLTFEVGTLGDGELPVIAFSSDGEWTPVESTYDAAAGTVTASTTHFSTWAVFRFDVGTLLADAARVMFGRIDASELTCAGSGLTDGHIAGLDKGDVRDAFSGCQRIEDGKLVIDLKNRRRGTFTILMPQGSNWEAKVKNHDLSETINQRAHDNVPSSRRFIVVPGGSVVTLKGDLRPGEELDFQIDMDLWSAVIDATFLALGAVNAPLGQLESGLSCIYSTHDLELAGPVTNKALRDLMERVWPCLEAVFAESGTLGKVFAAIVSPLLVIEQLGEHGLDILYGAGTRTLHVEREVAPPAPAGADSPQAAAEIVIGAVASQNRDEAAAVLAPDGTATDMYEALWSHQMDALMWNSAGGCRHAAETGRCRIAAGWALRVAQRDGRWFVVGAFALNDNTRPTTYCSTDTTPLNMRATPSLSGLILATIPVGSCEVFEASTEPDLVESDGVVWRFVYNPSGVVAWVADSKLRNAASSAAGSLLTDGELAKILSSTFLSTGEPVFMPTAKRYTIRVLFEQRNPIALAATVTYHGGDTRTNYAEIRDGHVVDEIIVRCGDCIDEPAAGPMAAKVAGWANPNPRTIRVN